MKTFFDRFWEVSKEKGYATPTEAGEAMGFPSATVSLWKTRGSVPRQTTIDKVAEFLGVSKDWLAGKPVDREGRSLVSGTENDSPILTAKGTPLIGKLPDGSVGMYVPRYDTKEPTQTTTYHNLDTNRVINGTLAILLFGDDASLITPEDLDEIRDYAQVVLNRRKRKG